EGNHVVQGQRRLQIIEWLSAAGQICRAASRQSVAVGRQLRFGERHAFRPEHFARDAIAQTGPLARAHRGAAAQIRQCVCGNPVTAVGRGEDRKQGRVLGDRLNLSLGGGVIGGWTAREQPYLASKGSRIAAARQGEVSGLGHRVVHYQRWLKDG